jgi:acetyl-CoA acyltransferase
MNMGRIIVQRAGLPFDVPGQTVNRFCSSGLQTIALAAQQIMAGMGECIVAGGAESMSLVPMTGHHFAPNPYLVDHRPEVYTGMGLTAENVAREWHVSREDQDAFALRSHQRALAAIEAGRFDAEIVPLEVESITLQDGRPVRRTSVFKRDGGPRADTSLEALARLRPVFHARQGHSRQFEPDERRGGRGAGDGALARRGARAAAAPALCQLRGGRRAAGGDGRRADRGGAQGAQARRLGPGGHRPDRAQRGVRGAVAGGDSRAGLCPERVSVNCGAIALGHPLGCSGAKLTVQLMHELERRGGRYGLVTMCVGGGIGAAGIFERMG